MTQQVNETQQTRQAWDAIATGYDAHVTPSHIWLAQQALDRVGLQPGERLLDVASGSGSVSIPAAQRGAQVVAIDISGEMIGRLAARARDEQLDIEARVMDGHHLELPDDTFDVALSQFGLMLFPDFRRGLSEMVRVTRPGGHVVVNAFGPPQEVQFLTTFLGAIKQNVPGFTGLPLDPPPLPFQVADPQKLQEELRQAGLSEIRLETVTETLRFRSGQEMWDWVINSNPIARQLTADLTPKQHEQVRATLEKTVRARADASGAAAFTNPVHIAIGTK